MKLIIKLVTLYARSYWAVLSATNVITEQNEYIRKLEGEVQRLEGELEQLSDTLENALCGVRFDD